ncbi:unnamed protein product [Litomosoides sigmodontis]|uniref:IgGFc-binding protein N-terminal domain-containing protein n=1 Tax=Litomosoides sigmodontis TaxID=42156 RepID=A0A3P6V5Y5_LITSI|nr:unnamed protein product [Litomosoides sigmodontis]
MMCYKIFLILVITYGEELHAQSISAATFGHNFTTLFPSTNKRSKENPEIGVTLINPNIRSASVSIKYAKGRFLRSLDEITVVVEPMSYRVVHFNDSLINRCENVAYKNFVECSDSRISISSLNEPIAVLSHWFLPDAGDSFLVFPTSMATNRYAFSAPAPAAGGLTTVYFLPERNDMTISVVGEIDERPFNYSFSPKLENGNLRTIQTISNLALTANANASFTVIVVVDELIASGGIGRTDLGIYMPTPLHDSETIFDCYHGNDYHIATLYAAKKFLIMKDDLRCDVECTIFDETEHTISYPLDELYNDFEFVEHGQTVGFNSSSAMLQVIRHCYRNKLISGSFLDLVVSWSQFVTDLTAFVVPSDENIVTVMGDTEATTSTISGSRIPAEFIWNWTPVDIYNKTFYYSTVSLPTGFYTISSRGFYTVFVAGQIQNAAYGFVTAYNGNQLWKLQ